MFSAEELAYWVEVGMRRVATGRILSQVEGDEPALMLYWAHKKRIRRVPDAVAKDAYDRYFALADAGGVRGDIKRGDIENVCEAIWGKLSEDERRRYPLMVE